MKLRAIKYNTPEERLRAIAQAEKEGATRWKENDTYLMTGDDCILIAVDWDWHDTKFNEQFHQEIPLDPEQPDPQPVAEKVTAKECYLAFLANAITTKHDYDFLVGMAHEAAKAFNEFEPKK